MSMRHPSVGRPNATNYYKEFGGNSTSFLTKSQYGIVPLASHYKVDGGGRDSYINIDNGGLFAPF